MSSCHAFSLVGLLDSSFCRSFKRKRAHSSLEANLPVDLKEHLDVLKLRSESGANVLLFWCIWIGVPSRLQSNKVQGRH